MDTTFMNSENSKTSHPRKTITQSFRWNKFKEQE